MKLVIVRHGDPDYSIDSLTEKGWKEAEYLSERLSKLEVKDFYVSPLGRAKDTASFTLKKIVTGYRNLMFSLTGRISQTERKFYGTGFRRTGHRTRDFISMITGLKTKDYRKQMPKAIMIM